MVTMPERQVPLKGEYDVLVAGAGLAGIAAAVYAARSGLKVGLLEATGRPGGVPTSSILGVISGAMLLNEPVVGGFYSELKDRLNNISANKTSGRIIVDPEILTALLLDILQENGIDTCFYTTITDAVCQDGKVAQIIAHAKSGFGAYQAKLFVDGTGDGDLAAFAGCEFETGRESDGAMQSATLVIEIGGIELDKVPEPLERRDIWQSAPREIPIDHVVITFLPRPDGTASGFVNMTHLMNFDPLDERQLTRARFEGTKQALYLIDVFRGEFSGFENAYLARTGESIGIRESRRFIGDYVLTEDDVLNGRSFPDEIVRCMWGIDVHSPDAIHTGIEIPLKASYGIPYRCITPKGIDNLYIAGRPISATHRAFSSSRINATCIGIGQAVGTAAGMTIAAGDTRGIDLDALRGKLISGGAILK